MFKLMFKFIVDRFPFDICAYCAPKYYSTVEGEESLHSLSKCSHMAIVYTVNNREVPLTVFLR